MTDDPFNVLANAVLRLSRAFRSIGMNPPKAIELASHEDIDMLRYMIPRNIIFSVQIDRGTDPEVVGNLCGVEIRGPAQFRAEKRGGYRIE